MSPKTYQTEDSVELVGDKLTPPIGKINLWKEMMARMSKDI